MNKKRRVDDLEAIPNKGYRFKDSEHFPSEEEWKCFHLLQHYKADMLKIIDKLEDRVKFLEEQDMKNAIRIHELQKHTGTHPRMG